nr:heparinase II/III family protein [Candidatus Sigynarchaeota archaeon]
MMIRKNALPAAVIIAGICFGFIFPHLDFGNNYPGPGLFGLLDYTRPGLAGVKANLDAGNETAAKVALHDYFLHRSWPPLHPYSGNIGYAANGNDIIARVFTINGVTHVLNDTGNRTVNGRVILNMNFHATPDEDMEWTWQLNRGYWMTDLAIAARGYLDVNNTALAEYYAAALVDLYTIFLDDEPVGSAFTWRTIDAAIRINQLILAIDLIKETVAFTPEFCFRYLSSFVDHGQFLFAFHKIRTNWAFIESDHMIMLASYLPEITASSSWANEAWETLQRSVRESVYPDGGTNEQSIEYHIVILGQALNSIQYANAYPFLVVPQGLNEATVNMTKFLVHNTMPDGRCTTFGHADMEYTAGSLGFASRLLDGDDAEIDYFDAAGNPIPANPVPRLNAGFSASGVFTSRTAWNDADALYSYFDGGPFGYGYHQNNDLFNVMTYAFGRRLLIDPGRYRYTADEISLYLRTAFAHNTWLIDDKDLFLVDAAGNAWIGGSMGSCSRASHIAFGALAEREFIAVNFREDPADIPLNKSGNADPARYWVASDFWHGSWTHDLAVQWQLPLHVPALIDNASNVVATAEPGIYCMKTNFPRGNLALYAFGPWTEVQNITGGDSATYGHPFGHWSREYNVLEDCTTYRFLGETSGAASWFTVLYPYETAVNITVAALPFTIAGNEYPATSSDRPANVILVQHPNGEAELHVSRRQDYRVADALEVSFRGSTYSIRGSQASLHFNATWATPVQVLARDLATLRIDGQVWIVANDSTISIHDAGLDYISMGIGSSTGMSIIVDGTPLAPGKYHVSENAVNIDLIG